MTIAEFDRRAAPPRVKLIVSMWLIAATGCSSPWRPPIDNVRRENLPAFFSLAEYAPDQDGWQWVYRRTRDGAVPTVYVREFVDQTYVDGALIGRAFRPLLSYLRDPSGPGSEAEAPRQRASAQSRRRAPLEGKLGAVVVFDPPLAPLPVAVRTNDPVSTTARLTCYDKWGQLAYQGTARRRVVFEGLEDVRAGQMDYPECLRLRVSTRFNLRWGPVIDMVQYLWMARGIGEVKRIERVTGWLLLWPFSATERFDLIEYRPPAGGSPRPRPPDTVFRRWARLAIEFHQTLPSPQIGGMRIELTDRNEYLAENRSEGTTEVLSSH